jgi:AsmA-like protein
MRSIFRTVLGIFLVTIALVVGAVLYLSFADLSVYKPDIEAAVSDALGHRVSIDGQLDIQLGDQVLLMAEDVSVSNPEWPEDPVYVRAGKISIAVNTWSILRGPIEIDTVEIDSIRADLRENADGQANWQRPTRQSQGDTVEDADAPVLHRLVIQDLLISSDRPGEKQQQLIVNSLNLVRDSPATMVVEIDGAYAAGSTSIPYSASTRLGLDSAAAELRDLRLVLGEGELSGSLSVSLDREKPLVVAQLKSPRLDLRFADTKAPVAASTEAGASETPFVFSDTPLDYSWLDTVDINAEIAVDELLLDSDQMRNLQLKITLADGALLVDPVGLTVGDGDISGSLGLRPDQGQYELAFVVQATNLRFGALAAEDQPRETIPPLTLAIEISGRGDSLHDIMSASSGLVSGTQSAGKANLRGAGFLFSDIIASILRTLNPLSEAEKLAALECGIYEIVIDEGVAKIEKLAVQTGKLTIISSGNIDLSSEALDLTLRTKTREGLGISLGGVVNSFLKIGGTLKAPSVGVDAAGSVTTAGAAVATGGLSVLARGLWDRVSAEADMCSDLAKPAAGNQGQTD